MFLEGSINGMILRYGSMIHHAKNRLENRVDRNKVDRRPRPR
jgi:hypothetical protein